MAGGLVRWVERHPWWTALVGAAGFVVWKFARDLSDRADEIPGPPYRLPATTSGDRIMYVATFATEGDARAFFAWAKVAYNGWASMLTPAEARANNNELLFIKQGVAAWVTFDPGAETVLSGWPILAMYKYTMAKPLM